MSIEHRKTIKLVLFIDHLINPRNIVVNRKSYRTFFWYKYSNTPVTGDFNLDISKSKTLHKVTYICQYFGLENLIMEPTHFTESSSSLIDLFLVSDKNNVLLSGVGTPFFDQNIRCPCPIYCVLKFKKKLSAVFNQHI